MKDPRIQIVVKEPNKPGFAKTIDNTLAAMQEIVGGKIEIFRFDPTGRFEGVCNDDFLYEGFEPNTYFPSIESLIRGTFFIAAPRMTRSGVEFRSMTNDEAAQLMASLG